MKTSTFLKTMLACFALGSSAVVMAAVTPSGTLAVSGKIAPAACKMTWPTTGNTAAYGTVTPSWAPYPQATYIGKIKLMMEVKCDSLIGIAFGVEDQREGTVPKSVSDESTVGANGMGLGLGTDGNMIGGYVVHMLSNTVRVDTGAGLVPGQGVFSPNKGGAWSAGGTGPLGLGNNANYLWGFNNGTGNTPTPALKVTTEFDVMTYLNNRQDFPTGDDVDLNGLINIILKYV